MGRTHGLQSSVDFSLRHRKRKAKGSPIRHGGLSSRASISSRDNCAIIVDLRKSYFVTSAMIYSPETNKSSLNRVDNGEADRNLHEKQNSQDCVFPDREIFDNAICFLHFGIRLFSIHPKILSQ